jgi:hypothetical protein
MKFYEIRDPIFGFITIEWEREIIDLWAIQRIYGLIHSGQGGPDAEIIRKRRHHRSIYQTSEVPTVEELNLLEEISDELGEIVCFVDEQGRY